MVAMVTTQTQMLWQPNRSACVAFGLLATVIVLAALIYMFNSSSEPAIRVVPIELRLASTAVTKQRHQQQKSPRFARLRKTEIISQQLLLVRPVKIPLKTIQPLSLPIDWQQQIEIAVKSQSQNNENSNARLGSKMQMFTPLQQALNAPRKPASMQEGESYRSIYGDVALKSNGLCAELQTIQVGPSPSNRATVAFPTECPGEHKPTMNEELSKWVDQEAIKHPPLR